MTPDTEPSSAGDGLVSLIASPRLRQRRFDTIPLRGPASATTEVQGRQPGDATTPAELSELISSISTVGVLQPVLAEEIDQGDAPPRLLLVTGERRLRACRWGAVNLPDNPHFNALPAIICPGPLSAEERRLWQIVENLAREPLRPGEQAAALLLHRCAVLTGKLLRAGKPISDDVAAIEDPVERWEELEKIRGQDPACAAPWPEVLRRIGLQLSPRKARQLVAAFKTLPRHISEEMDEAKIRLHTRVTLGRLMAGRKEAAEEIWAAVAARGETSLLPSAVQAALDDPQVTAEDALQRAERRRNDANEARAQALSNPPAGLPPELAAAVREQGQAAPRDVSSDGTEAAPPSATTPSPEHPTGRDEDPTSGEAATEAASRCLDALRDLTARLRAGRVPDRYTAGSLRLLIDEVRTLLDPEDSA